MHLKGSEKELDISKTMNCLLLATSFSLLEIENKKQQPEMSEDAWVGVGRSVVCKSRLNEPKHG